MKSGEAITHPREIYFNDQDAASEREAPNWVRVTHIIITEHLRRRPTAGEGKMKRRGNTGSGESSAACSLLQDRCHFYTTVVSLKLN